MSESIFFTTLLILSTVAIKQNNRETRSRAFEAILFFLKKNSAAILQNGIYDKALITCVLKRYFIQVQRQWYYRDKCAVDNIVFEMPPGINTLKLQVTLFVSSLIDCFIRTTDLSVSTSMVLKSCFAFVVFRCFKFFLVCQCYHSKPVTSSGIFLKAFWGMLTFSSVYSNYVTVIVLSYILSLGFSGIPAKRVRVF